MVSTGARGPTMGAIPENGTVIKKLPRLKTPAKALWNLHPIAATLTFAAPAAHYTDIHLLAIYNQVGMSGLHSLGSFLEVIRSEYGGVRPSKLGTNISKIRASHCIR